MRTFKVFGVGGDDQAQAAAEICAASPLEARDSAEKMFPDCPMVEVWEESVLIARIRRSRP